MIKSIITVLLSCLLMTNLSFANGKPEDSTIGWEDPSTSKPSVSVFLPNKYLVNTDDLFLKVTSLNDKNLKNIYYQLDGDSSLYEIDLINGAGETQKLSAGDIVSFYLEGYNITYNHYNDMNHRKHIDQVFVTSKHSQNKWKVIVRIEPTKPVPSGQPMPGIGLTLIIVLVVVCGLLTSRSIFKKKIITG